MKGTTNGRAATYGPLQQKTFALALQTFFEREVPQVGGHLSREVIVREVVSLVEEYFPRHEHMRLGQVMWPAVVESEHGSYGKSMEHTKIKPVYLDLIHADDIQALLDGEKAKQIKQRAAIRLFDQSKQQGGVLTGTDVGAMLKLSPGTISRYVREYEKENERLVPRRGTVHDMGPSLTHKKVICRKVILEGKGIEDTARETRHSPEAVTRYVKDYKRVFVCLQAGLSPQETAYAVKVSQKLVYEYCALIEEHRRSDGAAILSEEQDDVPF